MNAPDPVLLQIFAVEQGEHVQGLRALVDRLASATAEDSKNLINEFLRRAHTLKGASRAVGLEQTEQLTHRVESLFVLLRDQVITWTNEIGVIVSRLLDAIEDILAWALGKREGIDTSDIIADLDAVLGKPRESKPKETELKGTEQRESELKKEEPIVAQQKVAPAAVKESTTGPFPDLIRVNIDTLDEVIRSSSQLLAAASADAAISQRIETYVHNVDETLRQYKKYVRNAAPVLHKQRVTAGHNPVSECLDYVDGQLRRLLHEAQVIRNSQKRKAWELRQQVETLHNNACRARMAPADSAFGAFGAMLRELASQEGKQIEFRSKGLEEVQADRLVLQALKDPVMHLLRNAVFHGIEEKSERLASGKEPKGVIRLEVRSKGDRLQIRVRDDGRGLNRKAVAEEAVRRGLIADSPGSEPPTEELARFIFQPGFSTVRTITSLSGRGMGLSVVQQAVNRLQGEISVHSRVGEGTSISLSVPLSISTQHVLLVSLGGHTFAFATAMIEQLCRFERKNIRVVDGKEVVVIDSKPVPLVPLAEVLKLPQPSESAEPLQLIVVASNQAFYALVVDRLLDEREAIVKDPGLPEDGTGFSAGAIALEDGTVAMLLNVGKVLSNFSVKDRSNISFLVDTSKAKKARILVVDDSITTRSLERSILEAHGYEVEIAVDGLDALEKVHAREPDLIISDVNMPRMDGFQLLEQIKTSKKTSHLPMILVTSLESREEQEQGLSLGADAYIVKRKFDQRELLEIIRQIL